MRPAMECVQLGSLRLQASQFFRELNERRRRAREFAARESGQHLPAAAYVRPSDFEAFLERRLAKAAASIEVHVAGHRCQH